MRDRHVADIGLGMCDTQVAHVAARRRSTGSTQSCVSMSRTRDSALSGMETMTRSTRCGARIAQVRDLPSLRDRHGVGGAIVQPVSKRPMRVSRFPCAADRSINVGVLAATTITAALEAALGVHCQTSQRSDRRKTMSATAPPAYQLTSRRVTLFRRLEDESDEQPR